MNLKFKRSWLLLLSFVLMLGILAACSGGGEEAGTETDTGSETDTETEEPAAEGPQKGGTVVGAMDTPPSGQFNPIFYEEAYEANIIDFVYEGLVGQDENLEFIPSLAKEWTFNDDKSEVTFKLQDNAKWHDGEPFTADDVVFTYTMLASPGYIEAGGIRTYVAENLLGYDEFSAGESEEFPGVVKVDDHTVTFKFKEPNVKALGDAAFPIIPEHIFSGIAMADMPAAPESREAGKVVGTGPFKFTEMVQGEQYVLEKNADYWQGEPYLDSIVWKVVDQAVILGLLENGEIDFVADPNGFQAADFETVDAMPNVEIIEQPDFGYQIMGFMTNHGPIMDKSKWTVNEKLKDQKVRQAIAYAIDRQAIIDGLLYGRGIVQNSPIATQFEAYDDQNPPTYEYDAEKAKSLLDEAGYVDKDGDGFRENPDGEEWVLNLNYPLGNQLRERSAPIIEEYLEAVGISVDLVQPKEAPVYFEDLDVNSNGWDLFLIGWSLDSTDPDPGGIWRSDVPYNYPRWNNEAADAKLVEANKPPEAFDSAYRNEKLSEWQVMFGEDLPALILYAQNSLWAHNSRLQGIDVLPYTFYNNPHLWYVTE
jgi:peptide/nickel transport system substrate-binding protein